MEHARVLTFKRGRDVVKQNKGENERTQRPKKLRWLRIVLNQIRQFSLSPLALSLSLVKIVLDLSISGIILE